MQELFSQIKAADVHARIHFYKFYKILTPECPINQKIVQDDKISYITIFGWINQHIKCQIVTLLAF